MQTRDKHKAPNPNTLKRRQLYRQAATDIYIDTDISRYG